MTGAEEPALSPRVVAAEAAIAETRRHLDRALAAAHRDLALPLAAATVATAALGRIDGAPELGPLIRRHAVPLGLMALGAAWLAVRCRGTLRQAGGAYSHELLDRVRTIGGHAVDAALSAALDTPPRDSGEAMLPDAGAPRSPASGTDHHGVHPRVDDT